MLLAPRQCTGKISDIRSPFDTKNRYTY
jgi:hypothetical protein